MISLRQIFILLIISYFTNFAQDSNKVFYSLFIEKSEEFVKFDSKVIEGEFKEGSGFTIPDTKLPNSPFDFTVYQDLFDALAGGRFSIDYGALDNDIIMKIFIRNLDPDFGKYLNMGDDNDTLFSYFEIRIWELPDSNFYPEENSYYLNDGYYVRFLLQKTEAFLNFLASLGLEDDEDLAFAFFEEDNSNHSFWNGYGIETINSPESVEFRAIHLSRIGGGKRRIANNVIHPDSLLSINKIDIISNKFFLEQNYPNPFNPSTKIKYSVREPGFVSLKIYNILGSEIITLVNEYQSAGVYEVDFSTDELNNQLASGVYIYSLKQNSNIITKKMILTK